MEEPTGKAFSAHFYIAPADEQSGIVHDSDDAIQSAFLRELFFDTTDVLFITYQLYHKIFKAEAFSIKEPLSQIVVQPVQKIASYPRDVTPNWPDDEKPFIVRAPLSAQRDKVSLKKSRSF